MRCVIGVLVAIGLGLIGGEPVRAANLTWTGISGATWSTSSSNWSGASGATPWDVVSGPADSAVFNTAGASANATGNSLYANNITFTNSGTISGGTLNLTSASTIAMNATAGTSTISSSLVLGNLETFSNAASAGTSNVATLAVNGLISSSGTLIINPGGTDTSSNNATISLGGANDTLNYLQEGSSNHGTIAISSGANVNCNMFFVGFYGANVFNGNLTCGSIYCNNSNAGNQNISGSGTISTSVWLSNHSGTVNLTGLTGSLNVSGSFILGMGSFPGFVAGTNGAGGTINQTSGTVQLTGTGDLVNVGYNGTSTYKLAAGLLSIPNAPLELGYGANASGNTSTYNQSGGTANIYGISMGTTQAQGAQPGNCVITMTGGTLNLGAGGIIAGAGGGTKTVTMGACMIGSLAPWSTSVSMSLTSTALTTFNSSGGSIVLAGQLSGTGGLGATGGLLMLTNANNYTGGTTVSSGTLQLGDGVANVGAVTSNISTANSGVVLFATPNSGSPQTFSNAITGSGSLAVAGPGALILTNTSSFTGGTTISGGTLQLGDGFSNNGVVTGGIVNNATLAFSNPIPQAFAGAISGSGAVLVNGPASLALSGNNSFSGGAALAPNATLYINSNSALGSGTLTINGGNIDSTAAGITLGNIPQAWNGDFTFGGTNNLNLGSGSVTLGGNRMLTLNSGVLTVNGPIGDGGAGFSLSTTGTGTLVLGGTSGFSGGVNINSGVLVVNGGVTGSGGVTIQSGGTLAGSGLVSGGGVTVNGFATLSPGPSVLPGAVGTFTTSALSIGNGATIAFDLSTSNTGAGNDLVNVTGSLSLPSFATIAVNPTGGSLSQAGSYTLFNYGSLSSAGSPLSYSGPLGARQSANFSYGTGTNSAVTLTIAGYFANLIWTGTGSNTDTWDLNDTNNLSWTSVQHPSGDYFASLDNVTFDATSSPGNQTVNLSGQLTPSSVTVTGSKNYTFTGAGQISGATALTVVGPGSLTIQNPGNNYTSGTNIAGGSIILGTADGLPTAGMVTFGAATSNGTLDLAGNSQTVGGLAVAASANASRQTITSSSGNPTLTFAGGGSSTFGGTITDTAPTGVLALNVSSGQLVLSGSNNYQGGTTISGGTLQLGVTNALPANGTITMLPGGTWDLGGHGQTTSGTVSFQGGTAQNGTITSTSTAFDGQSGTLSANLAGAVALNKSSAGLLLVSSPSSSYTGGTNISDGVLQLGSANALPSGGNITVYSGATLDLGSVSQSTSGVVSIQGGTIQNGVLNSTAAAFDGQSGAVTANLTGGVGLNKTTSDMLTLGGSNSYTGNTVVSNGTLQLGSATGIPGGPFTGALVLDGGAAPGVVDVNGFSADVGGFSGAAGAVPGLIVNNAFSANATLNVGDNNANSTFNGTIADGNSTLGLNKTGTGMLTLSGSNSYSGSTTVSQGILVLTNTAALGTVTASSNLSVNSGGELQLPANAVTSVGNVNVAGSGVTGPGAINGGTLNVLSANITMNSPTGTAVIGSSVVLNAASSVISCTSTTATLLFTGPITSSGSVATSGSGNFAFGGVTSINGEFEEGNNTTARLQVISILPGASLSCGTYFAPFFSTLTVGGTMNANIFYTDNSTAGNQFLNGQGVTNAATFIGSGGGTVEFSNGVLNVTSSASFGSFGPFGTQRLGCTFQQDSGTVNMTGTGDGFTLGSNGATGNGAYTQYGGVLNVPNQYVELGYSSGTAANSFFQVLGTPSSPATANVYGISFGQTVNNGVQNGNGTVKLGDTGSLLVIGAGGIVAGGTGTQQFLLASGTLASSAPWSTTVPLTFNGSTPTHIDASAGSITLSGSLSGAGGLREIGTGTLTLAGTSSYTGGTFVNSGTLVLDGAQSLLAGSSLAIGSGSSPGAIFTPPPSAINGGIEVTTAPVPEPGSLVLLAIAALVGVGWRR